MRRGDRKIENKDIIDEIIRRSDICRIAFSDGSVPYIVAMNFGYEKGDCPALYFHCASEGRKMDSLRKNPYVCFQMDTDHRLYTGEKACDWGMKYSSILGYGEIMEVLDPEEKKKGLNLIMEHYGGGPDYVYKDGMFERTTVLKLQISEISAKSNIEK